MAKFQVLYLVVEADEKELPVFCGTKKETKEYLNIKSDGVFHCDVCRHTKVERKYYIENSGVREACYG